MRIFRLLPADLTAGIMLSIVVYCILSVVLGTAGGSAETLAPLAGETVTVSGTVKGDPSYAEAGAGIVKLRLKNISLGEYTENEFMQEVNIPGEIFLTTAGGGIERGDRIVVRGKLGEGFGAYAGTIFSAETLKHARPEPQSLMLRFRKMFSRAVTEQFGENEREARLGLAYLLGEKNGLDAETTEILRAVGLTHLVVASGTHLGILVEFFKKYFGKISRFAGLLFSGIFIFLFGEMIGWTASITRAAIVAGLSLLAWYSGRRVEAWRMILIAMATTLIINPMYVVDLGWLLSFASFIGIMILAPGMRRFFYGPRKKPGVVAEMVMASVAATLMCAPILLYFFGSLSILSIVANVLILPTMAVAMGLTFLVGGLGLLPGTLFGGLRWIVVKITTILLDYHLVVMEFFSRQASFIIQIPSGIAEVFLLYVPILLPFVVGGLIRAEKTQKRIKLFHEKPEKYLRFSNE